MGYLRDQAWNQTIYRLAFQPEWEKLGLTVSDDELVDMVQGDNISPGIKQAFTDQQTGQFDKARLIEYLKNLDKLPPESQAAWRNFEANLPAERLANKYNALLKNSVYVTTAEAKRFDANQNTKATVKYLFVPYGSISDSAVKVTDAQLQAYLDKNKGKYKVEDGRSMEYITVPVVASKEDSAAVKDIDGRPGHAVCLGPGRFAVCDAQLGAALQQGLPQPRRPARGAAQAAAPDRGQGVRPLRRKRHLLAVQSDRREQPATQPAARASHILIKAEGTTPEAKAAAKAKAQDILNKIKGGADFARHGPAVWHRRHQGPGRRPRLVWPGPHGARVRESHFWRYGHRPAAQRGGNFVRLPHHQSDGRCPPSRPTRWPR